MTRRSLYVESGAVLAGLSAHVVDQLLSHYLPPYLAKMHPAQRAEVESAHAAVHRAARAYLARPVGSVDGTAELPQALVASSSTHDWIETSEVARRLQVSTRRASSLAQAWAAEGLARKTGRAWLVSPVAVETYRAARSAA